jgi:pSer/pThr/pTyr-binding forkhead associated (FHA) protein
VAAVADVSIVIVQGPNEGREFEVNGAIVVGRDASAGLVIDDPEASRRHASLMLDGSTLTVEDLGSTNGTFVNGARISAPQELGNGDKLRIGTTVFEVHAEEPAAAEEEVQATRVGTALPDLDDLQVTAPRQVPDFAKDEPPAGPPTEEQPAAAEAAPAPPSPEPVAPEPIQPTAANIPQVPEPPTPAPVAPEPIQPTAAGIPQPPAPTNAPPPSAGPPGGIAGPPGGGPEAGPPPPPGGAPPPPSPAPPPPSAPPPPPSAPPPGFAPPPAGPPVQYGGGGVPAGPAYPVKLEADYPEGGITNWRPLVHWLLVIPHFFVLFFIVIAGYFAFIGAWFSILFTRRYPPGIFNFLTGAMRWSNRVNGYNWVMTEEYPPFTLDEAPYPIRTRFEYPEGGIARWRPFFQGFLAIPHFIVMYFLGIAAYVGYIIAFFSILFTGKYPPGVFNFIVGVMRWQTRVIAYALLMTEEYPPFSLD